MFTLEQQRDPLGDIVSALAGGAMQGHMQRETKNKQQSAFERVASQLTPESSPLDYAKAFAKERDLTPEAQETLMKIPEQYRKERESQASMQKEKNATQAEALKQQQQIESADPEAEYLGIDPEKYKRFSPETRQQLLKNAGKAAPKRNKYEPRPPEEAAAYQSIASRPDFLSMSEAQFEKATNEVGLNESDRKELRDARETGRSTDVENRKLLRDFHKDSEKFDEKLRESADTARKQIGAVQSIRKEVESGSVSPFSVGSIFKGTKIGDFFATASQGKFEASIPILIEGMRELFGVRLTDADLAIVRDKLPQIGKSPEANLAILEVIEKRAMEAIEKEAIGRDIKARNGKLRPLGYEDEISEELNRRLGINDQQSQSVKMLAPNGKTVLIPADKVEEALKKGAKKV